MTRIVLVRHGESVATVERLVVDHAGCKGLTDRGRAQASALRDRLASTGEMDGVAAVYTSILPRAIETAAIVCEALGHVAVQRCDFCEIHIGEGEGLTWEEFDSRFPRVDDDTPISPGSESITAFVARAGSALREVAERHAGETVLVVAHGGVIFASMHALGQVDTRRHFEMHAENTSMTCWSLPEGSARWRLDAYNDAAHLLDWRRP